MLATPTSSSTHGRHHSHKRSAAISGDFDLEFFKQIPSINQQLSTEGSRPSTPPSSKMLNSKGLPTLTITEPEFSPQKKDKTITFTPSPKKNHARTNSWAFPSKTVKDHLSSSSNTQAEYNSSSSNETTPDLKRQAVSIPSLASTHQSLSNCSSPQSKNAPYKIPEATIDLDLASCIYRDPSVSIKIGKSSKDINKKIFHRRTESAPELEDFLKYKIFTKDSSKKNSAIFEEDEEEEEEPHSDALSSSSLVSQLNESPSTNSLNSNCSSTVVPQHLTYSRNHHSSSNTYASITSTPSSVKTNSATRRGASATRYQSYYNNNILLSNALKSSDSLYQATATTNSSAGPKTASSQQKSSISGFNTSRSTPSTGSSLHSPIPQSPSRFNFDSQVYDMPDKPDTSSAVSKSTSPTNQISSSTTKSPSKYLFTSPNRHKKSNSFLKSFSDKILRTSSSSANLGNSPPSKPEQIQSPVNSSEQEYFEGDSTLTPFDFGEPGPELDLTTMIPKYHKDYNAALNNFSDNSCCSGNSEDKQSGFNKEVSVSDNKSPEKVDQKKKKKKESDKSKKTFFHWRLKK